MFIIGTFKRNTSCIPALDQVLQCWEMFCSGWGVVYRNLEIKQDDLLANYNWIIKMGKRKHFNWNCTY